MGQRRLIKNDEWFTFARGYFVLHGEIVREQVYSEDITNSKPSYEWKTVKKWPLDIFEKKHGEFKPELIKDHGK